MTIRSNFNAGPNEIQYPAPRWPNLDTLRHLLDSLVGETSITAFTTATLPSVYDFRLLHSYRAQDLYRFIQNV